MEFDASAVRFLGDAVDPDVFPVSAAELWHTCDGSRPLDSWEPADRERIARWHAAGLVVAVPAPRTAPVRALTFLSPHPDDAQLALGSTVFRFGGRVVDVFSDETWTRRPYYRERPALASRMLIEEERVSCRVLGAGLTLLGHLDGESRPAWRDGFLLGAESTVDVRRAEPELFERVVLDLARELADPSLVLVPLAVGGHVDHVVTREAVCELVVRGAVAPERIVFYEDMPYSLFGDPQADADRLAAVLSGRPSGPWGGCALTPVLIPGSDLSAEAKREALWPYRLQVMEPITNRIVRYGRGLGADAPAADTTAGGFAERVWAPAESVAAVRELAACAP